jgi:hypothetical protein
MMKLYLGGKMIGVDGFGFGYFDSAARSLRARGHVVFNPAERDRGVGFHPDGMAGTHEELANVGFNRREALTADMVWIGENSEGMVCLPNWADSPGTKAEMTFHHGLYLPVWELTDFIKFGIDAKQIPPLVSLDKIGLGEYQRFVASEVFNALQHERATNG